MARRNRRRRPIRLRSYQNSLAEGFNFRIDLEPGVGREILGVVLIGLAIFVFLAILRAAGQIGEIFYAMLRLGLGSTSFILPFLLLISGIALFYPRRYRMRAANFVGLALFLVVLSATIQLLAGGGESEPVGGLVGLLVSQGLLRVADHWGAAVILLVALLVFFLISLGQPLKDLARVIKALFSWPAASFKSTVKINANGAGRQLFRRRLRVKELGRGSLEKILPSQRGDQASRTKTGEFVPRFIQMVDWAPPPVGLLSNEATQVESGDIAKNVEIIHQTLAHFGLPVEMSEVNVGPTVTQYTLKPTTGVKLSRITALANDLALALAAHPLRIEAPIPGRSLVGVEVPNRRVALVRLREVLESPAFAKVSSPLMIPLGRDVAGQPLATDLVQMPHLLIAGATGAGKSVFLNSVLMALLYQNSPQELRIILVDPKRVEFTSYNEVPHLLAPVIVEPSKTINALKWLIGEMERRYQLLSDHKVRMIEIYNKLPDVSSLPYIVLIIDELADLMVVSAKEVEAYLVRLAQMARAVGIHLVISTQRPSVDVLTGLIKANFPSRIAFSVTSGVDSRTILDTIGAEKLLGNGDMLFLPQDLSRPRRIQGVFVADKEIKAVTDFLKKKNTVEYIDEIVRESERGSSFGWIEGAEDALLKEAAELVVRTGKASASYLQRRFRIGYARAARLLDLLEQRGIIGAGEGAKARPILVDRHDFLAEHGELPSGEEEKK